MTPCINILKVGMQAHVRMLFVGLVLSGLVACTAGPRPLQLISGAGPVYPEQAQEQGLEGYVVVQYDVSVQGIVENARVVEASPVGVFDDAALAAVRSWKFNAPRRDGQAVPARDRRSTVTFKTGDTSAYDGY